MLLLLKRLSKWPLRCKRVIKVLVPDVPTADDLLPYLRRIDAARWYSNSGPLVQELEARMGGVSVSSATLGLELAARCLFDWRRRVRVPAFTFAATATAVMRAGFEPILCDVGPDWSLIDPAEKQSLNVCPFGAPVSGGTLIDAASAWGNQTDGVRVYSLHATKSLPAGEGGIVCGPPELLERVRKLACFGFDRTAHTHGVVAEVGTNAKLSEYHAAVALAALDRWPETVAWRRALDAAYRERLAGVVDCQRRQEGVYTTFPVLVRDADAVAARMTGKGIETRRWYTPTLNRHPALQWLKTEGQLPNTATLNDSLLCLPFHRGITVADVDHICDRLKWAITSRV